MYLGDSTMENEVLKEPNKIQHPRPDSGNQIEQKRPSESGKKPSTGLASFINGDANQVLNKFGDPSRIDPSAYGYDWWIYNESSSYVQFGVSNNRVVTVFATDDKANISPFKIGQPIEDFYKQSSVENEVVVKQNDSTYKFELPEDELYVKPLLTLGDIYAQLYFDKFTGKLFSVRFMNKHTLLTMRPYEMVYKGELPKQPELTDEQWQAVERGEEEQIYDLTNTIRNHFNLNKLEWDEKTAAVAFAHSQEMFEKEYFSHDSPIKGDLADRLKDGKVEYNRAGENIAADYVDAIAAIEGWLNSKDHREALLEKKFTHIGVGVYKKQYTQNFIDLKR